MVWSVKGLALVLLLRNAAVDASPSIGVLDRLEGELVAFKVAAVGRLRTPVWRGTTSCLSCAGPSVGGTGFIIHQALPISRTK